MKPISYLEIAQYALETGNYRLFITAVRNRRRVLKKQMKKATAATVTQGSTPSKDTLTSYYQNGA